MSDRLLELRRRSIAVCPCTGEKHFYIADLYYDYDSYEAAFVLRGCVGDVQKALLAHCDECHIAYDNRIFPISNAFLYPSSDNVLIVEACITPAHLPRVEQGKPADQFLGCDVLP